MKDLIDEDVRECLSEGWDIVIDDFVSHYYNDESNFNNADPTTHMRCYEEHEIFDMVQDSLKRLSK